jgi:hypothetical protein
MGGTNLESELIAKAPASFGAGTFVCKLPLLGGASAQKLRIDAGNVTKSEMLCGKSDIYAECRKSTIYR